MNFFFKKLYNELAETKRALHDVRERSELLDEASGIGLWEAVMWESDAMHPKSVWTWSPEFRRLIGYNSAAEFPNVVQSWSDRLHPDDVAPTFAAFGGHLQDKSGRTRYQVEYRLKVADGSYKRFRATGGCRFSPDGKTVRACGSLSDISAEKSALESRAGDAGRGFAVVATEVRALAQRSADAAKEIKALISASGAQVARGVTLVGETGKALGRTLEQVEHLNRLVGEIAASTQEQSTALHQVNTAINQMDQVTQQNAAMVEQATAASHSLSGEATELAKLVAQFKTGATRSHGAARPAAKSRLPAHAPTGKFSRMPVKIVRSLQAITG